MIAQVCLLTITLFSLAITTIGQDNKLLRIDDFGDNPGKLKMYTNLNEVAGDTSPRPLLIALHGCSQNAKTMALQTGWNKIARNNNFYIVYPEQSVLNNISGCFNWFKCKDNQKDMGEVLSIRSMVDHMTGHYNIDTSMIMIYGLSAGGAMGVAMMSCYPELFSYGAILGGGPYGAACNSIDAMKVMNSPDSLSPQQRASMVIEQNPEYNGTYPKIIVVHGTEDVVVSPASATELIKQWNALHLTDQQTDSTFLGLSSVTTIEENIYRDSSNLPVVYSLFIENFGHAIPVDPGDDFNKGGDTGIFARDIDFHSTYYIARVFGLTDQQ